jgi:hypothetical protein
MNREIAVLASTALAVGALAAASSDPGPVTLRAPRIAAAPDAPLDELAALDTVPESCWAELRTKHIYFAHQAVGGNIVRGLEEAMRRRPSINIAVLPVKNGTAVPAEGAEGDEKSGRERKQDRKQDQKHEGGKSFAPPSAASFAQAGIVHGASGPDGDPEEKIDAFARFLRSPAAEMVDIAVLKLCYADIERSTDIDKLLEHYANTVKLVALERPNLRIVHCTVPLKEHERGAKAAMKKLVGAGSDAINAVRGRYNDALRRKFAADEILDIASAESTRADGSRVTFAVDGVHWPALASEYTDDGGHLNAKGQLVVAREMLLALSRTCPKPEAAKPTTDVASEPTEGSGR